MTAPTTHSQTNEEETTMRMPRYGQIVPGITHNGAELRTGVFDENRVRIAAGLTMAIGAVAFAYANFAKVFEPIQLVTILFFVDFLIRVTIGINHCPTGVVAGWMTRRQPPQWVSARPKRFAWALGLVMSAAMMVITNSDIHGALPRTICLICLALMWMEAVLGLCLGCQIYGVLARRGWVARTEGFEICSDGACDITFPQPVPASIPVPGR